MKDFLFTDLISFVGEAPKKFDGYKKYVSTGAVNGNIIESDDIELVNYSSRPSRANLVACSGDILFAKMAETEKTLLLDDETEKNIYSTGFCAIRAKENIIEPKALYYLLGSSLFLNQKNTNSSGATQRAITNTGLSKIRIKLPTMEKQREFYGIMDKVVNSIELRKKQLGYFDELTKSLFIEMFGDPINNSKNLPTTKLIDVVMLQRGYDLPINERAHDGNIPVFGSNGILGYHNKSKVVGGGVITGRSGSIGSVYYTKEDYWPLNTSLFSVKLNGNNIIFIAYLLKFFDLSRFADGTGVPTLNRNIIHDKQIINVIQSEQNRFAEYVSSIDKSKLAVKKSLEELEILKKSLMQKYFA